MMKTYSRKRNSDSNGEEEKLPSRTRSPVEDEEEHRHFLKVINAFKSYRGHLDQKIHLNKSLVDSLPENQRTLLKAYKESLLEIEKCIAHNHQLICSIIEDVESMFENTKIHKNDLNEEMHPSTVPSVMDIERVQTTLKQFVRDWSKEGEAERTACYQPIINEVDSYFPVDQFVRNDVKVLVPGSGLGRLAFEIAQRGFSCQGNEFSLFMLIASNFVLNKCHTQEMYSVYPWLHHVENNLTPEHQMQKISFPDVNPSILNKTCLTQFTMAAGDFLEIYKEPEDWHCVATCFFIDCANNIVDFVEKIYEILKPDGVWVNLGPLMYHFSNIPGEFSIEPPYSVVKEIITGIGFVMEKEETGVKTKYGQNPNSMLQYEYQSVFFVCRKPVHYDTDENVS